MEGLRPGKAGDIAGFVRPDELPEGKLPDIRGHEPLVGPPGSTLEFKEQLVPARQRVAVSGHGHPGQRAEPEFWSERRLADVIATDPRCFRGLPTRHDSKSIAPQHRPFPVRAPRLALWLSPTSRRG